VVKRSHQRLVRSSLEMASIPRCSMAINSV
jgi:hypothetical protein